MPCIACLWEGVGKSWDWVRTLEVAGQPVGEVLRAVEIGEAAPAGGYGAVPLPLGKQPPVPPPGALLACSVRQMFLSLHWCSLRLVNQQRPQQVRMYSRVQICR